MSIARVINGFFTKHLADQKNDPVHNFDNSVVANHPYRAPSSPVFDEVADTPNFPAVKEPETDSGKVRMLKEMVEALVEESARKDEKILELQNTIDRMKK